MKWLFLLALFFSNTAHAESWEESKGCPEAQTQADLNQCAARAWKQADADLATFEVDYIKRLNAEQAVLYKSAQTAWQTYRKEACEFESSGVLGGSAQPMVFSGCMETKAKLRLKELHELAECEEGDMACPASVGVSVPNQSFQGNATAALANCAAILAVGQGHSSAP